MAEIDLRHISNFALADINLRIRNQELFVLLGPSGAGKTTLLQVIAGLTKHKGEVYFNNVRVDQKEPHEREVGYVDQELLLFPHMSARKNIFLGMERLKLSKDDKNKRVSELLELFKIDSITAERRPEYLSGGEKQRVALARAVASLPKVLLLDEPFQVFAR